MVGLLGRGIIPTQVFYLHRTTQKNRNTNILAVSRIRTHNFKNQAIKASILSANWEN